MVLLQKRTSGKSNYSQGNGYCEEMWREGWECGRNTSISA